MVCYEAWAVRFPDGKGGVHITRKADVGWGEKDPVRDWRNISDIGILLAAEDALAMAGAIRDGGGLTVYDVSDPDLWISVEECAMTWHCGGWHVEAVGSATDWSGAFADELEAAAREARP